MIERMYTFELSHLRHDVAPGDDPDSDYLVWCYLINTMTTSQYLPAVITVKTPLTNKKTEI